MSTEGGTGRSRYVRRRAFRRPSHQSGAVAIMALAALIVICGFCGLALDLSRVYNRKMEMQSTADAAALGAAIELDGTTVGIGRAVQKVTSLFATPVFYGGPSFGYHKESMTWSDSAIKFAASPDGPWLARDAAAARSEPNGLLYVQVDTGGLDASYGQVDTLFMPIISSDLTLVSTSARAVAGPSAIAVLPLGICAMRPEEKRDRGAGELEEYGFRRGVSYDLMQLNPNASTAGQTFLIHPLAGPGSSGLSASDFNTVAPAVCTGTMGMARVMGADISVSTPFPLNTLFEQLNSRFDSYTPPCSPDTAPPDKNIKAYAISGGVSWMTTAPTEQASKLYPDATNNIRWTVTGPNPAPTGTKAEEYGPLWAYAKAVKYANPAPAGGYVAYDKSNWKDIYTPGQPTAKSTYPSSTPYLASGSAYNTAPTRTGVRDRRVLNVALLSCPVTGSNATVKGIGRFFMTVPADSTHLYAEFAGLADEQTLRTRVRLYK
jgi:hypothetical protein